MCARKRRERRGKGVGKASRPQAQRCAPASAENIGKVSYPRLALMVIGNASRPWLVMMVSGKVSHHMLGGLSIY